MLRLSRLDYALTPLGADYLLQLLDTLLLFWGNTSVRASAITHDSLPADSRWCTFIMGTAPNRLHVSVAQNNTLCVTRPSYVPTHTQTHTAVWMRGAEASTITWWNHISCPWLGAARISRSYKENVHVHKPPECSHPAHVRTLLCTCMYAPCNTH